MGREKRKIRLPRIAVRRLLRPGYSCMSWRFNYCVIEFCATIGKKGSIMGPSGFEPEIFSVSGRCHTN